MRDCSQESNHQMPAAPIVVSFGNDDDDAASRLCRIEHENERFTEDINDRHMDEQIEKLGGGGSCGPREKGGGGGNTNLTTQVCMLLESEINRR